MIETECCLVCKRNVHCHDMTIHHWHPTSLGGNDKQTMRLCKTCHAVLHEVIPIEEVINYKTPESLESHWIFNQYLSFIRTKNHPSQYKVKKLLRSILTPFVLKHYIKRPNPKKEVRVSSLQRR